MMKTQETKQASTPSTPEMLEQADDLKKQLARLLPKERSIVEVAVSLAAVGKLMADLLVEGARLKSNNNPIVIALQAIEGVETTADCLRRDVEKQLTAGWLAQIEGQGQTKQ